MKKNVLGRTVLSFAIMCSVFFLVSCHKSNTQTIIHRNAEAKYDLYESAEALESSAELVVIGEKTANEENVAIKLDHGDACHGYTLSGVIVDRVIKNETESAVSPGDTITVLENQFSYTDKDANSLVYHINQYRLMEPGSKYYLFLGYSDYDKCYYVISGMFGKIPVSEDELMIYPSSEISYVEGQPKEDDSELLQIMEQLRTQCLERY